MGYANAMRNSFNATMNIQHDNRNNNLILKIKYQTSPETPHLSESRKFAYGSDVSKDPEILRLIESIPNVTHLIGLYQVSKN